MLAAEARTEPRGSRWKRPWSTLLWGLIAAYCLAFSILSIARHYGFYSGEDVGHFSQMLWATLQGKLLHTSLAGLGRFAYVPHNHLADHFSPLLFALLPLYALWPEPELLLVVQSTALGLAALPLYLIVQERFQAPFLSLAVASAWLISPYVWQSNIADFHVDTFVPLFVFSACHALLKRRLGHYALFILLLLSCKEDAVVPAIAIGLFAALWVREVRVGTVTIVVALAWAVAALGLVMPALGGGLSYIGHYAQFGGSPGEILRTVFLRPDRVLAHLTQRPILEAAFWLFSTFAFLPAGSLLGLALVAPGALEKLLTSHRHINTLSWHYAASVLPFLFLASIMAAGNIVRLLETEHARRRALASIGGLLLVAGTVGGARQGFGLFGGGFTISLPVPAISRDGWIWVSKRDLEVRELLESVPPGASVSTSTHLAAHVFERFDIHVYPHRPLDRDVILLDVYGRKYPAGSARYKCAIARVLASGDYGVVEYRDGFLYLSKGHDTSRNRAVVEHVASITEADEMLGWNARTVLDFAAGNKLARFFAPTRAPHAVVWGPYLRLPPGRYEVAFRLKARARVPDGVARLEVTTDMGNRVLAERTVRGTDFRHANTYEEFRLGVQTGEALANVEFRVHFRGGRGMWIDRIHLYPEAFTLEAATAACAG
ncbi:MAG: DUF2079 domain-containing protein [Candidatus Rokuibacteriota bacterium]